MVVLKRFPHYANNIAKDMRIRIIDLPLVEKLRDLRKSNIGTLIRVAGVVTRRTGVFPMMTAIAYDCGSCGNLLGPFHTDGNDVRPGSCISCQATGPFRINGQKSEYSNFQKLTLQEAPSSVPAGRVPRYKDVNLHGDLIDKVRPGEEIELTGVYMHSQQGLARDKSGFPVFGTVIEANSIQNKSGNPNAFLTEKERSQMIALSHDPHIGERIIRSIAPSIYGHRHVKTAVALSLFGGVQKLANGGAHRVRGDINILLLGDPGTAKSQILKYAQKVAPRSVYTTGKGASAVGLTAGVHRDPITKEWTLEGGALVLADQGVCLIDEYVEPFSHRNIS
jgi:DNA replication licensing factor MCM2